MCSANDWKSRQRYALYENSRPISLLSRPASPLVGWKTPPHFLGLSRGFLVILGGLIP